MQVCVGRMTEKVIYNFFSSKNKDSDELKKRDATSWLNDRNKLLFSFLQRVTGVSSVSANEKKSKCTCAHSRTGVLHAKFK